MGTQHQFQLTYGANLRIISNIEASFGPIWHQIDKLLLLNVKNTFNLLVLLNETGVLYPNIKHYK